MDITRVLQPKIALGMIVKNEENVIIKTIESAMDAVDAVYIYDTGSTDSTIKVIKDLSKKYSTKEFFIRESVFKDFSHNRNELLGWIDDAYDIDFVLLLDANDEFHGCNELRKYALERMSNSSEDEGGFYIEQRWLYGEVIEIYYNIFFVRPRMEWRYYGKVHEYIGPKNIELSKVPLKCPNSIYIYQNRNENCEQSFIRYNRDKSILLKDLQENPNDPRTLFYLAQTCECLELYNEAYCYYIKRCLITTGLPEEVYHSKYRMGNICVRLNKPHEELIKNYTEAYELWNRVEPVLRLCEYYLVKNQPFIAYGYACIALFSHYPSNALLFVSSTDYNYRKFNRFVKTGLMVGDYGRSYDIVKSMVDLKIAQPEDYKYLEELTKILDNK